jgi:hypothetical protein
MFSTNIMKIGFAIDFFKKDISIKKYLFIGLSKLLANALVE